MPNNTTINPGPYSYTSSPYHQNNSAKFNRAVLAAAPFMATGSYANPTGFYASGSVAATITLTGGGSMTVSPAAAGTPAAVYEVGVYSVDAGAVYLLYK